METTINGTAGNDSLLGSGSDIEIFIASLGTDTLDGGGGTDFLSFEALTGPVSVNFSTGSATGAGFSTSFSNMDGVAGTAQNDTIIGDANDQIIKGGEGNDSLNGGGGFDWAEFIDAAGPVNANLATGTATGVGSDTLAGFEALLGTEFNDTLTGDSNNNWLEGSLGNDSMVGGLGFDTVGFSDGGFSSGIDVDLGTGVVTGGAGTDTISGFEAVVGSEFDDTITGDAGNNSLSGGLGADEFIVSLGNDTIVGGGLGDSEGDYDLLTFSDVTGPVTVDLGAGTASGSGFTVAFSQITGAIGTSGNDSIVGSAANEAMAGGLGVDTLVGGLGADMLFYGLAGGAVSVNLATNVVSGAHGADVISGFEWIIGSDFNDTLTGDDNDNKISGVLGDDSLVGGLGFDTLMFWGENDPVSGVSVNLATGVVTGGGGNDTISGFEAVEGTDFNDTITGDSGDNRFQPGSGNDSVVGGGGFDTVDYSDSEGGTGVNVNLASGVVTGSGGNDTLSGISGVVGSDFNDTLSGANAASKLEGGAGNDSIFGQGSNDTIYGGDGVDSIFAGSGNDSISGGAGHDGVIDGGGGFDTLGYSDYLSSANGYVFNFTFQGANGYSAVQISGIGNSYFEQDNGVINIEQFNGTGQGDVMRDLGFDREIEFNPGRGNDQVIGSPYDGSLDYVHYDDVTGVHLHIDLNQGSEALYNLGGFTGNAALFNNEDTLIEVDRLQAIGGIYATAGDDEILGSNWRSIEYFVPNAGADTVDGRGGFDIVDYYSAARGVNVALAAVGSATLVADDGYGTVAGAGSVDTLYNIEAIHGSNFNDVLTGNSADNRLRGRAGNDTIDGGAGLDIADYRNASTALNITLAESGDTTVSDGQGGTDTLRNIEALRGGNATNDVLNGNSAANQLFGLGGDDTLSGGAGNDTLDGQGGFDMVSYAYLSHAAGYVIDFDRESGTVAVAGVDTNADYAELDRVASIDIVRGSAAGDEITDLVAGRFMYLSGNTGDDTLTGNIEDYDFAIYFERDNTHVVTADLDAGTVTITKTNDGGYLEEDTLVDIRGVWGGQGADSLAGGDNDEYFRGFAGNDTIDGGAGMDIADFRSGSSVSITLAGAGDTVVSDGQGGSDTLRNIEGLSGTNGNDTLIGNGQDNWLRGRGGNDSIDGGAGNDTLSFTTASSSVSVDLSTGSVRDGEGGIDTIANIEFLLGGDFNDTLTGSNVNNRLEGRSGDDTLMGREGNDTLDGGDGFDYANYSYLGDVNGYSFVLSAGAMAISGKGSNSAYSETDQISSIDAWYASNGNDNLTDQVAGRQSFLQGRGGNDTLTGNIEDGDAASYWERGATVSVNANLATGVVSVTDSANLSYSETDTLVAINNVYGGSGADSLTGSRYNNYMRGGAGADTLDGGDGFDTVSFNNAIQAVNVVMAEAGSSFTAHDGIDSTDTLSNFEGVDGSNYDDRIVGNSSDNSLRGRKGYDHLDGGAGTDWADYAGAEYGLNLTLAESGNTTVLDDGYGSGDLLVNIEGFYGGEHDDRLTGNSKNNVFSGRAGNDTIDGLGGSDSVSFTFSSSALDIRMEEAGLDTVVDDGSGGTDVLRNIESIRASNFNDSVVGNGQDNALWGNLGADTLEGGDGNDTLVGDDGNDEMLGGAGIDIVSFSGAAAAVTASLVTGLSSGGGGNDTFDEVEGLAGTRFADSLTGGNANNGTDVLDGLIEIFRGEAGNDTINGGQGYDRADYTTSTVAVTVVLNDTLDGSAQDGLGGVDVLRSVEGVRGSNFNDTLTGSSTATFESFEGRAGNDSINGQGGIDRADYRFAAAGVIVNLASGTASDGDGGTDTLVGIENVRGSQSFNDSLSGDSNANRLEGLGGNDTLAGGAGNDTYVYTITADGADVVDDSSGAADVLAVYEAPLGGPDDYTRFERVGNDLVTRIYNAETAQLIGTLTLKNHYTSGTIETLDSYNKQGGLELSWTLSTSLSGTSADEIIAGGSAADSITGGDGNDWLFGAGGNDTLEGGIGNDTLVGGTGNDSLAGGDGDDTYLWAPGESGSDLVVDASGTGDALEVEAEGWVFTAERTGDTFGDLTFSATANGVVSSTLTLVGHFADGKIESLVLGRTGSQTEYFFVDGLFGTNQADWVVGTNVSDLCVGGDGGDQMFGGLGDDSLEGGTGNDVLSGGAGDDSLVGGTGSDTYVVDGTGDVVVEDAGDDGQIDTVNALIDYTLVANVENLVLFGNADLSGTGNELDNGLTGNSGQNVLDGGVGADIMNGGYGDDTYYVDDVGDVIVEETNALAPTGGLGLGLGDYQIETVYSTINFTLGTNLENLILAGVTGLTATGNELRNALTGNDGDNLLLGFGDSDTLDGGAGNDTLDGGTGNDSLVGGGGTDIARFSGNRADYTISFNNIAGTYAVVSAAEGADTVSGVESFEFADVTIAANIVVAGATFTGTSGNEIYTGGVGMDTLLGNGGNDTLDGGPGDDSLDGGTGIDTASYAGAPLGVTANLTSRTASGGAGNDVINGFENLQGSLFDDSLTGNTQANLLEGRDGNDSLNGGTGIDTLVGGDGDDQYTIDSLSDVVVENNSDPLTGGRDTIVTALDIAAVGASGIDLGLLAFENVENLRLTAAGAANGYGNGLNNILWAGDGDNSLNGSLGNDTVSYAFASGAVTASLTSRSATGASGNDILQGFENIVGTNYGDFLTGNTLANVLDGGGGADTMIGGTGADTFIGGNGSDLFYVDNPLDVVIETGSDVLSGKDSVYTSVSYSLVGMANVENIKLTTGDAINATGNELNNVLFSGTGDNVLDGGAGIDTANYLYIAGGVSVSLAIQGVAQNTGLAGFDTLLNVENLTGSSYNDTLMGGAGDNSMDGGLGVDTLSYANAGAAVIASMTAQSATGGAGNDIIRRFENLIGSSFDDTLTGNIGANQISGGNGADSIYGGIGADTLDGGDGSDTLVGADGRDELTGGAGADVFRYILARQSGITAPSRDTITDFSAAQGDKIDLSALDANVGLAGDQAFGSVTLTAAFSSSTSFSAAGQLVYDTTAQVLYGNVDGDTAAEFSIALTGVASLLIGDFVV